MNTFSERELSQLRLNYSRGQDLLCPRCGEILEEKLQSGGELFLGQVPGGPTFTHLIVRCEREGIVEKTVFGAR